MKNLKFISFLVLFVVTFFSNLEIEVNPTDIIISQEISLDEDDAMFIPTEKDAEFEATLISGRRNNSNSSESFINKSAYFFTLNTTVVGKDEIQINYKPYFSPVQSEEMIHLHRFSLF